METPTQKPNMFRDAQRLMADDFRNRYGKERKTFNAGMLNRSRLFALLVGEKTEEELRAMMDAQYGVDGRHSIAAIKRIAKRVHPEIEQA